MVSRALVELRAPPLDPMDHTVMMKMIGSEIPHQTDLKLVQDEPISVALLDIEDDEETALPQQQQLPFASDKNTNTNTDVSSSNKVTTTPQVEPLLPCAVESKMSINDVDEPQPRSIDTSTTTTATPITTALAINTVSASSTMVLVQPHLGDLFHTNATIFDATKSCSAVGGKLRDLKRLHGRSHEEQVILQAYHTAIHNHGQRNQDDNTNTKKKNKNTLIVIKGDEGMGKTALGQSLQDQVKKQDGGFFVTWNFDHGSSLEKDGGFDLAFTSLCQQILSAGPDVVVAIRDTIRAQLDPTERAVVAGMIPSLEPVMGPAEVNFDFNGLEASGRQLDIFQKFIRTLCSREHPLVFLMDDIQFSDPCSHILFSRVFPDTENDGILFIVTMGPEEQSANIDKVLQSLKETVDITTVELKPLDEEATNDMVADILKVEPEDSMPMTRFLYNFTKGNPLYVKELLRLMHQNGVLTFDYETKSWHCNEEHMDCVYQCSDFETLTKSNLKRLSPHVRDVLKAGACIGAKLDVAFLDVIMAAPVLAHVQSAVAAGLVEPVDEENGKYRFVNKGVRDAVYDLIPLEDRNRFHLSIGRKLLKGLDEDQLQESLSLVLSQIKCGASSMLNQKDRYATAALCLKAAEQSVQWSSFSMAAEWLDFGLANLGDRCWRDEYDLSLMVYNMAAEVAYTVGDIELVFKRVEIVLANTHEFEHKLQAYCTKINALNVSGRVDEALALGLDVLKQLDEPIQSNPSAALVAYETMRMKRFMKRKPSEKLRRLPTMTNHLKATAMQICNLLASPALFKRPFLFQLLAFRAVRITVSHGLCAVSAVAFGLYGMVLVSSPKNGSLVKEYTKLSLELLERFDTKQWLPRVYMIIYGVINIWDHDMAACTQPLQRGYSVGIETGDYEIALMCKNISCCFNFTCGTPLGILKNEMDSFTSQVIELNQTLMVYMHKTLVFMIESLMESNNIAAFDQKMKNDYTFCDVDLGQMSKCWFIFKKLILSYILRDYGRAVAYANEIKEVSVMSHTSMDEASLLLFDALARIAYCKDSGSNQQNSLGVVRRRLSLLKKFAKRNPDLCLGMQIFIEAELAALKGRHVVAAEKYLSCTSMFAHSKFLHLQAVASERAGEFMLQCGKRDRAKMYLVDSRDAFYAWGAMGKTVSLDCEINLL